VILTILRNGKLCYIVEFMNTEVADIQLLMCLKENCIQKESFSHSGRLEEASVSTFRRNVQPFIFNGWRVRE